jgi:HK97 gp10 family phage protein
MSDAVAIEVKGLAELTRALNAIPAQFARLIMREALHAAGDVMKAAAESTAPVRTRLLKEDIVVQVYVQGDLSHNSVRVGPGYDRAALTVRKTGKHAGRPDTTASPGVYGRFVETGHKLEFGSGSVPPHPWLRPAFEVSKEAALDAFVEYAQGGLEAVVAAVAVKA